MDQQPDLAAQLAEAQRQAAHWQEQYDLAAAARTEALDLYVKAAKDLADSAELLRKVMDELWRVKAGIKPEQRN